jgi:hypothetical protein
MDANKTEMCEVTTDDLRTVEGGSLLRLLSDIGAKLQQQLTEANSVYNRGTTETPLVHEPMHQ